MSKNKEYTRNIKFWRTFAVIIMLCGFAALEFTFVSIYEAPFDAGTNKYIFENIGTAFMGAYALLGLLTLKKFKDYSPILSKFEKQSLDERQLSLRQRVLGRSYNLLGAFSLLAIVFFQQPDQRMATMLWWFVILTFLLLPTVVASWQEDI